MHRCTRILYTRGGTAGGLSSGELIDNPNTDTPAIGRTARTTSGLPRTERSILRTLRGEEVDTHAHLIVQHHTDLTRRQIQAIVDEYQDRVLEDYRNLGMMLRFENSRAQ